MARLGGGTLAEDIGIPYGSIRPTVTITTPSTKHARETAVIDTGFLGSISMNVIADYPTRSGLTKEDEYTRGIVGRWRSLTGQLDGDIQLASVIWRDRPIRGAVVHNLIGAGALSTLKLVIDQKKKMLWLVGEGKVTVPKLEGHFESDGRQAVFGFACLPDGDGSLVKEVDPGSRAEHASLKVGDRILKGTPEWDENYGKAPRRVRLQISSGSEKLEITLSLWEPLPDGRYRRRKNRR